MLWHYLIFRLEFMTPKKRMESLITFCDRKFDQLLTLLTNLKPPRQYDDYYEERWRRQNITEFREILSTSSRSYLIEKIGTHEKNQLTNNENLHFLQTSNQNLRKRINDLVKLIETYDKKEIKFKGNINDLDLGLEEMDTTHRNVK